MNPYEKAAMDRPTPAGITPPTPGLDHEEPDLMMEDDIPRDDRPAVREGERALQRSAPEEQGGRGHHKPERE